MQLKLWIDDNNYLTFDILMDRNGLTGHDAVPEIGAASLTDSKLSNLRQDQILAITGDLLDYVNAEKTPAQQPAGDWFTNEWLPATRIV